MSRLGCSEHKMKEIQKNKQSLIINPKREQWRNTTMLTKQYQTENKPKLLNTQSNQKC